MQALRTLRRLPIGNITMLRESKILSVVQRWAQESIEQETLQPNMKKSVPRNEPSTEVSATCALEEANDSQDAMESESISINEESLCK